MIKPEDVTVLIPHLGNSKEQCYSLKQTLGSLWETTKSKIIVVKNGGSQCIDPKECIQHTFIIEKQGQCKAVNAAAAIVTTPWIFVSNDDMIYSPGWFEELTDSDWGLCISPQLVEPKSGAPTFEVFFAGGAGGDFDKQKFLGFVENYQSATMVRPGFNLPFLISKDLWDTIGGYDINYDPWGSNSDSDLEYKIKLAGVQPIQNTSSKVYHFSQTSGTFEPKNQSYWQKNWDYFIQKWGFPRTDDGIWEATFKIPTKEQGRKFNPEWEGKYGEVS